MGRRGVELRLKKALGFGFAWLDALIGDWRHGAVASAAGDGDRRWDGTTPVSPEALTAREHMMAGVFKARQRGSVVHGGDGETTARRGSSAAWRVVSETRLTDEDAQVLSENGRFQALISPNF